MRARQRPTITREGAGLWAASSGAGIRLLELFGLGVESTEDAWEQLLDYGVIVSVTAGVAALLVLTFKVARWRAAKQDARRAAVAELAARAKTHLREAAAAADSSLSSSSSSKHSYCVIEFLFEELRDTLERSKARRRLLCAPTTATANSSSSSGGGDSSSMRDYNDSLKSPGHTFGAFADWSGSSLLDSGLELRAVWPEVEAIVQQDSRVLRSDIRVSGGAFKACWKMVLGNQASVQVGTGSSSSVRGQPVVVGARVVPGVSTGVQQQGKVLQSTNYHPPPEPAAPYPPVTPGGESEQQQRRKSFGGRSTTPGRNAADNGAAAVATAKPMFRF